ncbi:MAG: hypothetical protein AB7O89_08205, partial [Parachlamydiales bacterium]
QLKNRRLTLILHAGKKLKFCQGDALNLSQDQFVPKGTSPALHCEGPPGLLVSPQPMPKQLNLNKLGDAGGSQIQWLPTLAEINFLPACSI